VRIAESGAFSKAADSMNVPRATVTKLIQDLERHLGTKLLQRTTRRVNVTPAGAVYYERAARLIADLDEMDDVAMQARAQPRGRIRVDVGSVLANMIVIPALPGFRARHPDLHVDLGVGDRSIDLIGLLTPRTQPRIFAMLATADLVMRTNVSIRIGKPEGPTAVVILPVLPVRSKWARKNSVFALSKTTTRRLGLASMRASKPCKAWYNVASTMLRGG